MPVSRPSGPRCVSTPPATATPNIKQPKFRWISVGAAVAILAWVLASVAFGFYVSNFSSYNKTYGSLAGVIVFLLWLWITNLALLFGAEIDAELERARELQAGIKTVSPLPHEIGAVADFLERGRPGQNGSGTPKRALVPELTRSYVPGRCAAPAETTPC